MVLRSTAIVDVDGMTSNPRRLLVEGKKCQKATVNKGPEQSKRCVAKVFPALILWMQCGVGYGELCESQKYLYQSDLVPSGKVLWKEATARGL